MAEEKEIEAKGTWAEKGPLLGSLGGAMARSANVVARGVYDTVALRRSEPADQIVGTQWRMPRKLPNAYLASFIAVVVIPSFLCIIYLTFIASDQYVAEGRFAIQSAQFGLSSDDKSKGTLSSLSVGSIPSLASQDAYIITNYIHSRAIIDDLKGKIDIRAIFRRPEADFWARLKRNATAEDLTQYWDQMVATYIDGPSGIVTLDIRTFRPADSQSLAEAVLKASEKLANDVSERSRVTIMRQAEDEVQRSEGLVRSALVDEQEFRDKQGFIDPASAATSTSTLLLQVMAQRIALQNSYFVATKAMSPSAPTAIELKTQLDGLDNQIVTLKSELTGDSSRTRNISAALVTYEKLELKRVFSEKLYSMAQDALERARLRAEQQNIFISTFVPPSVPQEAEYPQRLALVLLIPIGFAVVWGIFALISAAIDDHRY